MNKQTVVCEKIAVLPRELIFGRFCGISRVLGQDRSGVATPREVEVLFPFSCSGQTANYEITFSDSLFFRLRAAAEPPL